MVIKYCSVTAAHVRFTVGRSLRLSCRLCKKGIGIIRRFYKNEGCKKNAILNHKGSEHCTIHLDRENPSTDGYIRIDKGDGFYAEYQIRDEAFLEDLFGKILHK